LPGLVLNTDKTASKKGKNARKVPLILPQHRHNPAGSSCTESKLCQTVSDIRPMPRVEPDQTGVLRSNLQLGGETKTSSVSITEIQMTVQR
jgi:hypothetical protein